MYDPSGPAAMISFMGNDALLAMPCSIPLLWQALAIANSPSGWMSFTRAAGLTKRGMLKLQPRILVLALTSLTFRRTRGRRKMRSKEDLLASRVIRSLEALE